MSWNEQKRVGASYRDELLDRAIDTGTPADRDGSEAYGPLQSRTTSTKGPSDENISNLERRMKVCDAAVTAISAAAHEAGMADDGKTLDRIDALGDNVIQGLKGVRAKLEDKLKKGGKLAPAELETSLTSKKSKAGQEYDEVSRKFLTELESLVSEISAKSGKSGSWKLNLCDMMVNHDTSWAIAKKLNIPQGDAFKYINAGALDGLKMRVEQFDPTSNAPLTDFGFLFGQVFELFLPQDETPQPSVRAGEEGASFLGGAPGGGAGQAATPGLAPRPGVNGYSSPEDAAHPTDDIDGNIGPGGGGSGGAFVGSTAEATQTPRSPLIGALTITTDNSKHCTTNNTTYNISLGFGAPPASASAAFPYRAADLVWSESSVTRESTSAGASEPNADVISQSEGNQADAAPKQSSADVSTPPTVSPNANQSDVASAPSPLAVNATATPSKKAEEPASSTNANTQVAQDGERSTSDTPVPANTVGTSSDRVAPPTVSPSANQSNAASPPSPLAMNASATPSKKTEKPASSTGANTQVARDGEHSTSGNPVPADTVGTSSVSIAPPKVSPSAIGGNATSHAATSNFAERAGTRPRIAEAGSVVGTDAGAGSIERPPLNAPATISLSDLGQGDSTAKPLTPLASSKPATTQDGMPPAGKRSSPSAVAPRPFAKGEFIRPAGNTISFGGDTRAQNGSGGEGLLSTGQRSVNSRVGESLRHSPGKTLGSDSYVSRADGRASRGLSTSVRHIPNAISAAQKGEDEVDLREKLPMDEVEFGGKRPMRSGGEVAPPQMPNVYDAGLDGSVGRELKRATQNTTATVVSGNSADAEPLVGWSNVNRSSGRISSETSSRTIRAVEDDPKAASVPRGRTFASSQSTVQRSGVSGSARKAATDEANGPNNWRRMAMMMSKSSGGNIPKKLTAQESDLNVHLFPKEPAQPSNQKGLWWDTNKFVSAQYVVDDFQSELNALRADSPNKLANREPVSAVTGANERQAAEGPQET